LEKHEIDVASFLAFATSCVFLKSMCARVNIRNFRVCSVLELDRMVTWVRLLGPVALVPLGYIWVKAHRNIGPR
jgi:hypothetical protein